jgi:hypothetical protein
MFDLLGVSEQARKNVARLQKSWAEGGCGRDYSQEWAAPTDAQIDRARRKLHSIANPVGLMIVGEQSVASDPESGLAARNRLNLEACKALLAIRIYVARKGTSPASLKELVREGIISELPQDVYSGRPLRYSSDPCVLWSIGSDSKNRHGALRYSPFPADTVRWDLAMPK